MLIKPHFVERSHVMFALNLTNRNAEMRHGYLSALPLA